MVGVNKLGSDEVPGYSSLAMMRLVRNIANKVEKLDFKKALLTSDCPGVFNSVNYAIVAHGTYQDSWRQPKSWAPGLYPNW